ncbi:DcrB-related protein [Roseateles sp. BYS180W]|uniref:DcrB-related protein n=1 Tax=Roseateles rivi TaxID=3299028 RepID=A0ABW7FQN1_9BURK
MYLIQEASLNLPEPLQDRSVNVLSYVEPGTQAPFQIVLNRDVLIGEETIAQCFERQLSLLGRQTKQFKILRKDVQQREGGLQPLHTVESSFVQAARTHYQLQCMLLTASAPKLLVLTLSSGVALNDGHRRFWNELLATLDPAQPAS